MWTGTLVGRYASKVMQMLMLPAINLGLLI